MTLSKPHQLTYLMQDHANSYVDVSVVQDVVPGDFTLVKSQ